MRTLLALALALVALALPACACGGWEGAGDTVMRRTGGDALILCSNGGYAAMLSSGALMEGRYDWSADIVGTSETGAHAFRLTSDGTEPSFGSTELGDGWQIVTLDEVELDHAHVQCTDLEARAWWSATSPTPGT